MILSTEVLPYTVSRSPRLACGILRNIIARMSINHTPAGRRRSSAFYILLYLNGLDCVDSQMTYNRRPCSVSFASRKKRTGWLADERKTDVSPVCSARLWVYAERSMEAVAYRRWRHSPVQNELVYSVTLTKSEKKAQRVSLYLLLVSSSSSSSSAACCCCCCCCCSDQSERCGCVLIYYVTRDAVHYQSDVHRVGLCSADDSSPRVVSHSQKWSSATTLVVALSSLE